MDGYLKDNLDFLAKLPENDFDVVGLCAGYEGTGKTTLFEQIAYYWDKNFNIDHIVFNAEQFSEAVDKLPPKSCILYDEADDSVVGSNWMREKVKTVISLMKRIRKKNLFILFVTPTFFDMSKYFAIHRARFLVKVYTYGLNRGYFHFFDKDAIRKLYFSGKKEWDWSKGKYTFRGYFRKHPEGFPIDKDEYESKKDAASRQIITKPDITQSKIKAFKKRLLMRLIGMDSFSRKQLASLFEVSERSIGRYKEESVKSMSLINEPSSEVKNVDLKSTSKE